MGYVGTAYRIEQTTGRLSGPYESSREQGPALFTLDSDRADPDPSTIATVNGVRCREIVKPVSILRRTVGPGEVGARVCHYTFFFNRANEVKFTENRELAARFARRNEFAPL